MWTGLKTSYLVYALVSVWLLLPWASFSASTIQLPMEQYRSLLSDLESSNESLEIALSLSNSLRLRITDLQTLNSSMLNSLNSLVTTNAELHNSLSSEREKLIALSNSNSKLETEFKTVLELSDRLKTEIALKQTELEVWKIVGISAGSGLIVIGVGIVVKYFIDKINEG